MRHRTVQYSFEAVNAHALVTQTWKKFHFFRIRLLEAQRCNVEMWGLLSWCVHFLLRHWSVSNNYLCHSINPILQQSLVQILLQQHHKPISIKVWQLLLKKSFIEATSTLSMMTSILRFWSLFWSRRCRCILCFSDKSPWKKMDKCCHRCHSHLIIHLNSLTEFLVQEYLSSRVTWSPKTTGRCLRFIAQSFHERRHPNHSPIMS